MNVTKQDIEEYLLKSTKFNDAVEVLVKTYLAFNRSGLTGALEFQITAGESKEDSAVYRISVEKVDK